MRRVLRQFERHPRRNDCPGIHLFAGGRLSRRSDPGPAATLSPRSRSRLFSLHSGPVAYDWDVGDHGPAAGGGLAEPRAYDEIPDVSDDNCHLGHGRPEGAGRALGHDSCEPVECPRPNHW